MSKASKTIKSKRFAAQRRAGRVRSKIQGSRQRPRVSVFSSLTGMFVQFIDDGQGATLLSGRTSGPGKKTEQAGVLGKSLAEKAKSLGFREIIFDRGSKKYHGRIKALAQALRDGGLKF